MRRYSCVNRALGERVPHAVWTDAAMDEHRIKARPGVWPATLGAGEHQPRIDALEVSQDANRPGSQMHDAVSARPLPRLVSRRFNHD